MRKIIYYVAVSLDGFIAGPDEDISRFVQQSSGIDTYLKDLKDFDTVIMGRKTYEFGYKFGLVPGEPAYPHMEHYIFSGTLKLDRPHPKIHVEKPDLQKIDVLKNSPGTDIYLCGGGEFAGWLLDHGKIDMLKLKLNPILLGAGIGLFGHSKTQANLKLIKTEQFTGGLQIITYELKQ